jgi:hypothetical protein
LLASAASALAASRLGRGSRAADDVDGGGFVLKSQPLPEPRVVLPTDALPDPRRDGPPRRVAAVVTSYFRYSHADDIVTKFLEGYSVVGRTHRPHCEVVSISVEQVPETDIGRPLAARYRVPFFNGDVAAALTLGTGRLAADGVLLIGEHGDYPFNARGQHLYPRRRLFEEVVEVFRRSGRSVPVYCDKHLSYDWPSALWMYEQSRALRFAMMAGSSVPVAWRRPPLAFKPGVPLDAALAVGFSGVEVYGFHTLELLQAFAEKRRGGETGIRSVRCLSGDAVTDAAAQGLWRPELLFAALKTLPAPASASMAKAREALLRTPPGAVSNPEPGATQFLKDVLRRADPEAVVFLVEYRDGFRGAAYVSRGLSDEFAFAASVRGRSEPVATWCELNKPQRDHFSFLCNHIEVMFRTGRPSYPVERTLLVTGALAALMQSHAERGALIATPHLADLGYTPAPDLTAS